MTITNQNTSGQIDQVPSWHFSPENRTKLKTAQHATVDIIAPIAKIALETTSAILLPVVPATLTAVVIEVCVDETARAAKNNADNSIDLSQTCVDKSNNLVESTKEFASVQREEKRSASSCIIL